LPSAGRLSVRTLPEERSAFEQALGGHPTWAENGPDCGEPVLDGLSGMTRLLTAEEVAERLGMTKDWVWAQARAGRIPHVQLGRYRRFREDALDEWLAELEQRSGARWPAVRS
jgi:excisionase family DNA binding protein